PATVILSSSITSLTAFAGFDQVVMTGATVYLDGTRSSVTNASNATSSVLSYEWSFTAKPAGSNAVLSNQTSALPSFIADMAGDFIVQLNVTDPSGKSALDSVIIRDQSVNVLPVANAGRDQQTTKNALVVLDGSASTDANGDALSYQWAIIGRPVGSTAQLNNAKTRNPDFTPDVEGDFVIQLFVSDGKSISLPDVVVIHDVDKNLAPTAVISPPLAGTSGTLSSFDGSNSADLNGDALTYAWVLFPPVGSNSVLQNSSAVKPTFMPDIEGTYTVTLVVSDGSLSSSSVNASMKVAAPPKGGAVVLPPGKNLLMLSSIGGDSGTGALIAIDEQD
ncbi:MAG: PKD domain-containing protein, partial [Shewanella sp.]